jgi:hypothetical protein
LSDRGWGQQQEGVDEYFQESAFTIMHFQHDKGYLLGIVNFSFLPQMTQQQQDVDRWFFVLKGTLLFAVAAAAAIL